MDISLMNQVAIALENNGIAHYIDKDGSIHTMLPISQLRTPKVILRPVEQSKVPAIAASIIRYGQLQEIVVKPETEDGTLVFTVFDGLHRIAAMETINPDFEAKVVIRENASMSVSIIANTMRQEQNPAQVAKAILYLVESEHLNFSEIAERYQVTPEFINKHFMLNVLSSEGMDALQSGRISLAQATEVAKMEKVASGQIPFTKEQKEEILRDALDGKSSVDLATKKAKFRREMGIAKRQAEAQAIVKPVYKHVEVFSAERWDETKKLADHIIEECELDNRLPTEKEAELIRIVDYVMTRTVEDQQKSLEAFNKEHGIK